MIFQMLCNRAVCHSTTAELDKQEKKCIIINIVIIKTAISKKWEMHVFPDIPTKKITNLMSKCQNMFSVYIYIYI